MWPRTDPGGLLGHASGIVGTLLMLWAAFGYSWRKRPAQRAADSARTWMGSHVVAGLAGPALVLLHGGLTFRGLAGVTTALMLVVVASGVVGRWLYTMLPRDVEVAQAATEAAAEHAAVRDDALLEEERDDGGGVAVATRAATVAAREAQGRALLAHHARAERHAARLRAGARARRVLAAWWVLHVPLSMAMLLLALIHALAALYYRTPGP